MARSILILDGKEIDLGIETYYSVKAILTSAELEIVRRNANRVNTMGILAKIEKLPASMRQAAIDAVLMAYEHKPDQ